MNVLLLQEWVDVIKEEYLDGFVKDGGSTIKFAVPVEEELRPLLTKTLTGVADNLGYIVIGVDSGDTRVHMPQEIFFKIASQIDWKVLAKRVILKLCEDMGYVTSTINPESESSILEAVSSTNSVEEYLINLELRKRLPGEVTSKVNMSRDFRVAMTHLCLAEMSSAASDRRASALIEWLTGTNRRISNVRSYSIHNSIVRSNAKHLLESLLYWVRYAGYSGSVVLLDSSRVTLLRNPRDGQLFYSRSAVMDHYEVLRELIDGTDRLRGLFMVVLAAPAFLDDAPLGKGYSIYRALMGRIAQEVSDRSQANPMAALVRLADAVR